MNQARFAEITSKYRALRVAVVGDFCLDRYLEIDPQKSELSIETGLEVYNVVNVRSQPGAAGTILNNLVALGVGEIVPLGFCGEDGEGYELLRALRGKHGVRTNFFLQTPDRRTFTYCKPLVLEPGRPPRELNRLDSKNWSPTPRAAQDALVNSLHALAGQLDAVVLMDQVDVAETGVITSGVLAAVGGLARACPDLLILGDSRRSLRGWPPVCLKMNSAELRALTGEARPLDATTVGETAGSLARQHGKPVFVTLAERGIVAGLPSGASAHAPAWPVRGEIDVVGAGDAVTANLTAALASGASLGEALELAMAAASIVVHQLGTTGTANVGGLAELLQVS